MQAPPQPIHGNTWIVPWSFIALRSSFASWRWCYGCLIIACSVARLSRAHFSFSRIHLMPISPTITCRKSPATSAPQKMGKRGRQTDSSMHRNQFVLFVGLKTIKSLLPCYRLAIQPPPIKGTPILWGYNECNLRNKTNKVQCPFSER